MTIVFINNAFFYIINMVNGACISIVGFEDVTKSELENFGCKDIVINKGFLTFTAKNYLKIAEVAYLSRTGSRVLNLLGETVISKKIDNQSIAKLIEKIDFKEWFSSNTSFRVECERIGEHDFLSIDVEKLFGGLIIESVNKKLGFKPRVALDNPDLIIYIDILDDRLILGIDFCGFDLAKRDYHIFVCKTAIRGNVGASMILYADVPDKKVILDTMSSSGTIPIEAALISSGISHNQFRKEAFVFKKLIPLKNEDFEKFFTNFEKTKKKKNWKIIASDPILANVMSTNKNAKIAEVNDLIETTRIDFDWLDIKIEKNNVDAIITKMASPSKNNVLKDVEKMYKEFFYQAEYILKKKGKIVCLLINDTLFTEIGKKYKFKKIDSRNIMIGKQPCVVVTYGFE